MICDTSSSQDAFTHQIWNSYLKEYLRYASDSMQFLESTRSYIRSKVQGHSDQIMVRDTLSFQDATTHQIWNSYLKEYRSMHWTRSGMEGGTVRLLYASQSSFGA